MMLATNVKVVSIMSNYAATEVILETISLCYLAESFSDDIKWSVFSMNSAALQFQYLMHEI